MSTIMTFCPSCNGKVFDYERMASPRGFGFHKKCFTCEDCNRALDASLVCDGEERDGQILCHNCYKKR